MLSRDEFTNSINQTTLLKACSDACLYGLYHSARIYLDELNSCPGSCVICGIRQLSRHTALETLQAYHTELKRRGLVIPNLNTLEPSGSLAPEQAQEFTGVVNYLAATHKKFAF